VGHGRAGGGRAACVALLMMLGAGLGVTASAQAASTVAGQWRFDEPTGQRAIDDGPFGLDARLGATDGDDGADPSRIAGASGGALHFDGHAFVRLPPAAALAPANLALEAVVRAGSSPGTFRYVVAHGAEGCVAGSYGLYTGRDGGIAFYVFDGHAFQVSAAAAPSDVWNGAWHHVAGVFDGHAIRLYVDGRPVGAPFPAALSIAYGLTSADTYFGSYEGTCSLPMAGDIDLVRLWNGPLAPDFVGNLADTALAPPAVTPPAVDQPDPQTVPVASQSDSDATAPGRRPTLAPIAPGTTIPTTLKATGGTAPVSRPNSPAPACVITPSVHRLRSGRVTTVEVTVSLRKKPLHAVRVIARQSSSRYSLAVGKTSAKGRARLRIHPRKRDVVRVQVVGRKDCAAARLSIITPRRR
jgi:hypothetical protein